MATEAHFAMEFGRQNEEERLPWSFQ
ncbi:uncharacterized protein G2W53_019056 [Senna tora]|uniref:Uncharacterized protein n=1 Tax=Senna tora TaxID=362788 RepID=A0A834TUU4_9FABA|nr:uncharacterized protein G2W53_019056 [Senna tora]